MKGGLGESRYYLRGDTIFKFINSPMFYRITYLVIRFTSLFPPQSLPNEWRQGVDASVQ